MWTIHYISVAVQDCVNDSGGNTRRNRFCTVVRMELALRVTAYQVAKFAARERLQLLDETVMTALLYHDLSLMQS